jgi:hypothetical protein
MWNADMDRYRETLRQQDSDPKNPRPVIAARTILNGCVLDYCGL